MGTTAREDGLASVPDSPLNVADAKQQVLPVALPSGMGHDMGVHPADWAHFSASKSAVATHSQAHVGASGSALWAIRSDAGDAERSAWAAERPVTAAWATAARPRATTTRVATAVFMVR